MSGNESMDIRQEYVNSWIPALRYMGNLQIIYCFPMSHITMVQMLIGLSESCHRLECLLMPYPSMNNEFPTLTVQHIEMYTPRGYSLEPSSSCFRHLHLNKLKVGTRIHIII